MCAVRTVLDFDVDVFPVLIDSVNIKTDIPSAYERVSQFLLTANTLHTDVFIIIAEKTPASVSGEMNRQKVRPVRKKFVLRK